MPSSHKKVIVRRFSGDLLSGYLPSSGFLQAACVDLLGLDGRRTLVPLEEIRSICFVRDFALGDMTAPDRLARKLFSGRPRAEGLWLRLTFQQDADELEGLATPDLTLFDDLLRDGGVFLAPPDTRGNTQRIFIPHRAIADLRVLGVTGAPGKRKQSSPLTTEPPPIPTPQLSQGTLFRTPEKAPAAVIPDPEEDRDAS